MGKRNSKLEFFALLTFMAVVALILTNGFAGRISAEKTEVDVYKEIEPIGDVLAEILNKYVREPELDKIVEGALSGMMRSLDKHSAYIPPEGYEAITEDTQGEFEGIGVSIQMDEERNLITVHHTIPDSPAAKAGVRIDDIIIKINDESAEGMSLADAAKRIKGPRGTTVKLTVVRRYDDPKKEPEELEFEIKRDKIPLESISESGIIQDHIGYVRLRDFNRHVGDDLREKLKELQKQGMKALVLDLRWNPGGLLTAAGDVAELFLPKATLVTYTKGRAGSKDNPTDDMKLETKKDAVVPDSLPIVVLTSGTTASSSEIVTGALQYYKRAIVVGEKTYGKGSVQTVIALRRPAGSALRLTTALYYTPGGVCIDQEGIHPDVEIVLDREKQWELLKQMMTSFEDQANYGKIQNHGSISGHPVTEETIEDEQLQRAVEILKESTMFDELVAKYHLDISETQMSVEDSKRNAKNNHDEATQDESDIEEIMEPPSAP